jgi:predicted peptidase
MRFLTSIIAFCVIFASMRCSIARAEEKSSQSAMEKEITVKAKLKFFVALPEGYEKAASEGSANEKSVEKYPLLIFLHGAGEQGADLNAIKIHGMPKLLDKGKKFPFIVVSPQSPTNTWQPEILNAFIDDLLATYRVDTDRIYMTGISMGGAGTWNYATAYPDRLAAIAPICGAGFDKLAPKVAKLPIWAFHGALDDRVPIAKMAEMIKAVQDAGGNPKFTIYPTAKHDSWSKTYENKELYEWLLEQKRRK